MLNKNFAPFFLFCGILMVWLSSCPAAPKLNSTVGNDSNAKTAPASSDDACNTFATVKDMTGMDGCRFMLILRDGKKYRPVKTAQPEFKYRDGQTVKFGYVILKDMMSICMAEDEMVEITCIEETDEIARDEKCIKAISPYDIKWLKALEGKIRPYQISRFDYEGEYAYLFKTKTKQYLYDCYANLVCEVEGKQMNDCVKLIKSLDKEVVIWVVNH